MSNQSILSKIAGLKKSVNTTQRVEMTDLQVEQCKEALRRDNRGFNVQPNRFDMANPYRVAINYVQKWHNYGNFSSADVAAAIGSIVSLAYFGDKAVSGDYDEKVIDGHAEFVAWLADARNQDVIAMANGDKPAVCDGGVLAAPSKDAKPAETEENPF